MKISPLDRAMTSLDLTCLVGALLLLLCTTNLAGPRSSANYIITSETADAGGRRAVSATYTQDGSVGTIAGITAAVSPSETAKIGYIGQLYEIAGFVVSASPATVNEGERRQLDAWHLLDDASYLSIDPTQVSWSILDGPITSISTSGLATADIVYRNTAANVRGTYQGNLSPFVLTVLNTESDNFGSYAGDRIDDDWQVLYFGENNPNAGPNIDADGTGYGNLFKFIAGLNPLDGSRFVLSIQSISGQPTRRNLIFSPLSAGRTYTVKFAESLLTATWFALPQSTQSDNGPVRTVTDLDASRAPKFYRVEISKP